MPIFEYKCDNCENTWEVLILSGPETTKCPSCHSTRIIKLISVSNAHFKGSGFYKTDYTDKKEEKRE